MQYIDGIGIEPPDDNEWSGVSVPYYINTVRRVSILSVTALSALSYTR